MAFAIWNPATYYVPNDIVDYEGLVYIATGLQPNINQTPESAGTDYWGVTGGSVTPLPSGVQSVTANGPAAVRACKRLVKDVAARPITPELRDDTARRIADIRASAEGREGVQSFLNKAKPNWLLP